MTIKVPLHVRSSDITGYKECEMKWWLNHLYADEKPDAVWFHLGTALHSGFEVAIRDELDVAEATDYVIAEYEWMVMKTEGEGRGYIDQKRWSPRTRAKRGIHTAIDDIVRMMLKWFDTIHPDGTNRIEYFNELQWPPISLERKISTFVPGGYYLHTTADTVFQHATHDFVRPIIDWKTGASAGKSKDLQLWTYQYGGRLEGWIDERQKYPGVFVDVDHGKIQHVDEYPGDDVMRNWVVTTAERKKQTHLNGPLAFKDWWCNYCPVREFCPQEGDGDWDDIHDRLDRVEWLIRPEKGQE